MMKAHIFKVLAVAMAVACLFPSCGEDDDGAGGNNLFMRFKANGTQVEYTMQASLYASFSTSATLNLCLMSGADATTNVSLQAYDTVAVSERAYTGYDITPSGKVYGALIGYDNAAGVLFTQGSGANHDALITITEITATTVRGTFRGTLKATGQTDIDITDGEFLVQRSN